MSKIFLPILLFALVAFTAACPQRRSIAELQADPGRYRDKEVAIAGRVVDSYGGSVPGTKIGGGAYKVDDGTGSIWVITTEDGVPSRGVEIGVKGKISNGISWRGRNYGLGLYEKDRRYRKR